MNSLQHITDSDIESALDRAFSEDNHMWGMKDYATTPDARHIKLCQDAQKKLCEDKCYPYFAPYDGQCFNCGNQIYDKISFQRASTDLITGCPHCHRSYCD